MGNRNAERFGLSAEQLLDEARNRKAGRRGEGYKDDKCLVEYTDIITLLGAGAHAVVLNAEESSGYYAHEVIYRGHRFLGYTKEPAKDTDKY